MKNDVLSRIHVAETGRILPFEWPDPHSQFTQEDLDLLQIVKHPFPVVDREDGTFLLLEDAPLFRAFEETGILHLPVQIFHRKQVRLNNHRLALIGYGFNDLARLASKYSDQIIIGEKGAESPTGYVTLRFHFPYRDDFPVFLRHSTKVGCPVPLEAIFRQILEQGRYLPNIDRRQRSDSLCRTSSFAGTMDLPAFDLGDLEAAASSDRLFPPHAAHILTDTRVFNVDFPLSILRADLPLGDKESFLRDLIAMREQAYRTTFFEGQVIILNR